MLLLYTYWFLMALALIAHLATKRQQSSVVSKNAVPLLLICAASFLIIAIVTKDPLFSAFGVPPEFEWVVGLFITGFTAWQIYFNPLKERIVNTEREIGILVQSVKNLGADVHLIKEAVIGKNSKRH